MPESKIELWIRSYVILSLLERGSISSEELAEFTARCADDGSPGVILTVAESAQVIKQIAEHFTFVDDSSLTGRRFMQVQIDPESEPVTYDGKTSRLIRDGNEPIAMLQADMFGKMSIVWPHNSKPSVNVDSEEEAIDWFAKNG